MRTSETGLLLIKDFEGFSPIPYKCPAGRMTIGYGHVIRKGELYSRIDEADASLLLKVDLCEFEDAVERLVEVPLNQNQFDALVSFAFNVGADRLKNSTLLRTLNSGNFGEAASQFLRWIFADGKALNGLRVRRAAEAALFLRPIEKTACAPA